MITPDILLRLGWIDPEAWAPILQTACDKNAINTPSRVAMFLANVGHESGGGRRLVESLDYTPAALLNQWPKHFTPETAQAMGRTPGHAADQRGIAEAAYGQRMGNNLPGDGWHWRGRGLLQITGRAGYSRAAVMLGIPMDGLAAALETRQGAADSAAGWWRLSGCNALADAGKVAAVRAIVNGGSIGLDDVAARYRVAMAALGGA
jgi:putative chitinase